MIIKPSLLSIFAAKFLKPSQLPGFKILKINSFNSKSKFMMNKLFTSLAALLVLAALSLSSCKDDDEPKTTKVYGTITFENANVWQTWADSGEVQVTIFPKFSLDPLAGWGEIPAGTLGPTHPGGTFAVGAPYNSQNPVILQYEAGKTQYNYEIEVEPGTYSALAVGFRHNFVNDPSLKTATLGAHWGNETQVSHGIVIKINAGGSVIPIFNYPPPSTIEIKEGEQKEINFKADFAFVEQWYQ